MRLTYKILNDAKTQVKKALATPEFKEYIFAQEFTYTKHSRVFIYCKLTVPFAYSIKFFSVPWWRFWWRGVAGTIRRPSTILLNRSYRPANMNQLCGIVVHELCHLLGFSHGANYLAGNKGKKYFDSVPVKVQKYIEGE